MTVFSQLCFIQRSSSNDHGHLVQGYIGLDFYRHHALVFLEITLSFTQLYTRDQQQAPIDRLAHYWLAFLNDVVFEFF